MPTPFKAMIKKALGTMNVELKVQNVNAIVSDNNLSAPKASSTRRSLLEFADVLENYIHPPILDLIPRIFERDMPEFMGSTCVRQAWLAKYAWTFHSAPHAIFADRVMTSILGNEASRNEVADVFGAEIIREYVRRRGQLSFRIEDVE